MLVAMLMAVVIVALMFVGQVFMGLMNVVQRGLCRVRLQVVFECICRTQRCAFQARRGEPIKLPDPDRKLLFLKLKNAAQNYELPPKDNV